MSIVVQSIIVNPKSIEIREGTDIVVTVKYSPSNATTKDFNISLVDGNINNNIRYEKLNKTSFRVSSTGVDKCKLLITSSDNSSISSIVNVNSKPSVRKPSDFFWVIQGKTIDLRFEKGYNAQSTLVNFMWVDKTPTQPEYDVETSENNIVFEVPEFSTLYGVRLKSINNNGDSSEWTEVINFISGRYLGTLPGLPTNVLSRVDGDKLIIDFEKPIDVQSVEFDFSWEDNHIDVTTNENNIITDLPEKTLIPRYRFRSKNEDGVYSEWSEFYHALANKVYKNSYIAHNEYYFSSGQRLYGELCARYNGYFDYPVSYRRSPSSGTIGTLKKGDIIIPKNPYNLVEGTLENNVPVYPIESMKFEVAASNPAGKVCTIIPMAVDVISGGEIYRDVFVTSEVWGNDGGPVDKSLESVGYLDGLWTLSFQEGYFTNASNSIYAPENPIVNNNIAIIGAFIEANLDYADYEIELMNGIRLKSRTAVYDKDGSVITYIESGGWVWTTSQRCHYAPFEIMPNDYTKVSIHSFSQNVDKYEVGSNVKYVDRKFDTYYVDLSAIDFKSYNYNDSSIVEGNLPGYFGKNTGPKALLWMGEAFAVRKKPKHIFASLSDEAEFEFNSTASMENVVGMLHQGYLFHSKTGGDELEFAKNICEVKHQKFSKRMGPLKKYTQRHDFQEFYSICGYFDTQRFNNESFIVGRLGQVFTNTGYNHAQYSTHMQTETGEHDEPYIGSLSPYIGSVKPFLQYIAHRIRTRSITVGGEPLDLMKYVYSSFDSHFAVFNEARLTYKVFGVDRHDTLYGVRVKHDAYVGLYENETYVANFNKLKTLRKDDWIWFSESFEPTFDINDRTRISILGYSEGSNSKGDPIGEIKIQPLWFESGVDKTKGRKNIVDFHSFHQYNLATIASKDGVDPTLLYEREEYRKDINNSLCYNSTGAPINVTDNDGNVEYIYESRLFTYICEYHVGIIKRCRVYYYSDKDKKYKYGYIATTGASILKYDLRNCKKIFSLLPYTKTTTIPIEVESSLYTSYGEFNGKIMPNDIICIDKEIVYPEKNTNNKLNTIIKGPNMVFDYDKFEELNKPNVEPIRPNWLKITHYALNSNFTNIKYVKFNGYVELDFSVPYTFDYL